MKLLLVTPSKNCLDNIIDALPSAEKHLIHYSNPLKATDNIQEILPDAVLFDAEEFPRHWKPFLQVFRQLEKPELPFILLTGESFDAEEEAKAAALGVDLTVSSLLDNAEQINSLMLLLEPFLPSAPQPPEAQEQSTPVQTETAGPQRIRDDLEFIFNHPASFRLVTGRIIEAAFDGILFQPDNPESCSDIPEGSIIPICSISFGGKIAGVSMKLMSSSTTLALRFTSFEEGDRIDFLKYLDKMPVS